MDSAISYFAITNARPPHQPFGLYQADRLQHAYVIGKTGTGKSTLLETLIRQDIMHGRGVILLFIGVTIAGLVASVFLGFISLWVGLLAWTVGFLYHWRFR